MIRPALVGATLALLASAAGAQTYHDLGGTIVPGVVPIAPNVGPWFTPTNPANVNCVSGCGGGTVTLGPGSAVIGAVTQSGPWSAGRTWSLSSAGDSVNVGSLGGTAVSTGSGTTDAGTQRVVANQGAAGASAWLMTGNVGGFEFQLAPTITVTQSSQYAANTSLGGTIVLTGATRANGGSGVLNGLRLRSAQGATNTVWIYAWSKTPASTCTDKSAFVASAADAPNALVGFPQSVTLASPGAFDTASYGNITAQIANFVNKDTSPGTALYFCLVTTGTVTFSSTADLTFTASGMQD